MAEPCKLKWVRLPKAKCSCGRTFELDSYKLIQSPRAQEDSLMDAYLDHLKGKSGAPPNK